MEKIKCKNNIINFLSSLFSNEKQQNLIKTKFRNISSKTG